MFKMKKIKLEIIVDNDICMFLEKGIGGGFSYNSNRYIKANNKYLKPCDPSKNQKLLYT